MAIHVIAELVARDGHETDLRNLLTPFALQSRTEPGCLGYDLLEVADEPGRFMTVEIWADQAAIAAHMSTPQIQAALPVLAPLLAKPFTQTMLGKLT